MIQEGFMLFLVAAVSSVITLEGDHWFLFWWPVAQRKFSIYFRQAPLSLDSSGIAGRQNQLSMDSQKSLNSSYWSDVVHSKVGVFKLVAGWFGISNLRKLLGVQGGQLQRWQVHLAGPYL